MMQGSLILSFVALAGAQSKSAQYGNYSQYGGSPAVYPSPNITGIGGWEAALSKAKTFLSNLNLEEKAQMVTGTPGPCVGNISPIPRLNFSGLCLQDGPLAIRQAIDASVFPAGLTVAASWDRSLARERGVHMASEFRGKGSHVALGPVVGPLGRSPFGGRNWEGFSPDSYLSGALVEDTIEGMQSVGVQACVKHFILNEQETQRNPSVSENGVTIEAVSSNVDDKTMHETYLWPFANAVRAGSASVMCSYNRINGSYGCQNSKTLNGLLKEELGFQGYVMSDWLATHTGVAAIEAGLDMDMPGGIGFTSGTPTYFGANVTMAVNNGSLALGRLDDMILRIMTPYYYLGQDNNYPRIDAYTPKLNFYPESAYLYNYTYGPEVNVRSAASTQLIRELGAAGTVLLKNTNNTLPLQQPMKIAVFGNDAADLTTGQYYSDDFDIGTLPVGGGSGTGRFYQISPPLDAIKSRGQSYGAHVQYIMDNKFISQIGLSSLAPVPIDVCIVFLKSWASEGSDRTTLIPEWNSTTVVERVTSVCNNTVVVLHGASPNTMPWRNNANITAILVAHMPGEETGKSIVDILWGDVNPSGKLPYTIANNEMDYRHNIENSTTLQDTNKPVAWQADFVEGNLIDYKEFDAENKSVAFPFGFGLSYTTFEVSNPKTQIVVANASRTPDPNAPIHPGGNVELWATLVTVEVTVTNTGPKRGAAVPQLYLSYPSEAGMPVRSLRGFEKILLNPNESKSVLFNLARRDVSYWNVTSQKWTIPAGSITVGVGFSSRDLPLQSTFTI
ncbi:glycoside hydrolase family 3 protein [Bipolaris zeicola 26-R-13]|uniref:Probable beta-glucosidase G n=1 Tax=Cochliobolus carbonum (strain 26-R-13) TaxID=930089 RepID=W6XJG9_COCC2|nr:glycoside hydrolase family 3 protein [Bipolaris zeicola 26-R-13]EUC27282.1 glycoside hydrolase family 3 protein [Bipolaris zeicola 26-R-13]